MMGDLASNAAYYSLVHGAKRPVFRGLVLGLLAGAGAVFLPPVLGLGKKPSRRARQTSMLTVAWYTLGGLTSGLIYRGMAKAS